MSRRRRTLSSEDKVLWHHVTRSVRAAPGRAAPAPDLEESAKTPEPVLAAPALLAPEAPKPKGPPPLAPLERKMVRGLARGTVDIEARLDLHGLNQEAAHRRLYAFLREAQARGYKVVVVITGKGGPKRATPLGADPHSERGVLRRMVPHWLGLPDLRTIVLGFEEAGPAHGGAGALYVRLRRARGA
ncbi:MAG: Smr/MutS family protein [Alphaproteobacteria bacterium]